jgi:hypothetical protein
LAVARRFNGGKTEMKRFLPCAAGHAQQKRSAEISGELGLLKG